MFIRTPYNYDTEMASLEAGLHCEDESLAVQSQKEEADINTLLKRFGITGQMPQDMRMPQYGDFTGISSYQDAMFAVKAAEIEFLKLPGHIRKRFGHDPEQLLAFMAEDKNREEAEKLGLLAIKQQAAERDEAMPKSSEAANSSNAEKTKG